jgi:hypothetical protein
MTKFDHTYCSSANMVIMMVHGVRCTKFSSRCIDQCASIISRARSATYYRSRVRMAGTSHDVGPDVKTNGIILLKIETVV